MAVAQRNNWNVGNAEVSPHSHFAPLLGKHTGTRCFCSQNTAPVQIPGGGDCSSSPAESTGGDLRRCYPSGLTSGAFQQEELYLAAS